MKKVIKILHIFDYRDFHKRINSVIFENVKKENESKILKSYMYAPKYNGKEKFILNKNTNIFEFIQNKKIDFVIFHSLYKIEYLKLYKKLIELNIPYFIRPHGSFSFKVMEKNRIKKFLLNYFLFNNFINKAKGFIYLSKEEEKYSYFKNKKNKEIYYLPNMIEVNNKVSNQIINKKINIIYLGKFDFYYKNILFMLEVMNSLLSKEQNIEFNLYGPIEKNKYKLLKNYLNKKIKYHKEVFGEEKNKVYSTADIFILLSISEGLPMVVLEALNNGVPCFVSKNTNMGEQLEKYGAGWGVELNSVEDVCKKLSYAIKEYKNNQNKIKNNIKKLLNSEFKWSILRNEKIYINIIKNKEKYGKQ